MRHIDGGRISLRHFSGPIHCPRRQAAAVINAVERAQGGRRVCSILWCSLRGAEQWCGEDCLVSATPGQLEPAAVQPSVGQGAQAEGL